MGDKDHKAGTKTGVGPWTHPVRDGTHPGRIPSGTGRIPSGTGRIPDASHPGRDASRTHPIRDGTHPGRRMRPGRRPDKLANQSQSSLAFLAVCCLGCVEFEEMRARTPKDPVAMAGMSAIATGSKGPACRSYHAQRRPLLRIARCLLLHIAHATLRRRPDRARVPGVSARCG